MTDQDVTAPQIRSQEPGKRPDLFHETYVTPKQIAEHLMVTEQTVRSWLIEGLLVGRKFGAIWRITKRDFESFVKLSIKRGQRYEPSEALKACVESNSYEILDAYGGGAEVTMVLDIDPADQEKDELYLTSNLVDAKTTNQAGEVVINFEEAPRYLGTMCIIDSDVNPYGEITVMADSHSEVLVKLVEQASQLQRMFGNK